jgi:hypothetical protein
MGVATNEFVVVAGKDLIRFLKLVKELKGEVTHSDTASNFVRLRFRGSPCNNEYVGNVLRFLRESGGLVSSCKCLNAYVNHLRISGNVNERLALIKSCVTRCVAVGGKTLCVKRSDGVELVLEILTTPYSINVRAYPASTGGQLTSTLSSLREVFSCDDSLIRKLLSIECELEKCLSGV